MHALLARYGQGEKLSNSRKKFLTTTYKPFSSSQFAVCFKIVYEPNLY